MAQCAIGPYTPSQAPVSVGRGPELAALSDGLARACAGRGSLFVATGEPGIGKTRLADDAGRLAAERGVRVHWGRAWEAGGAPPFWPFVQVLRDVRGGDATDLLELLPDLRGVDPSRPVADPGRFGLFDAVGRFLRAAGADAPRLVVLDDLHAADPSSLELLHFLARDLRSAHVMVLGTWRDAEARQQPEVRRALARIAREGAVLSLRRLTCEEVGDLATALDGAPLSDAQVRALHGRTEGNPLFVREVLRLPVRSTAVPDGIRDVLRARIAGLPAEVRRRLEAAAVLGREFRAAELSALAGADGHGALAKAADAGIVEPHDEATWRFTHALLLDALQADLAAEARRELHRRAAAVVGRRADPAPAEVAHHLLCALPAVPVAAAADAAIRAAAEAMRVHAAEEAAALLERMLDPLAASVGEERRRFEILLGAGVARIHAGDFAVGRDRCAWAIALAREQGDGEGLARAVLGSACDHVPGVRDGELVARLEEALAGLPPGDGPLRARCLVQLAAERQPEPDTAGPVRLAREGLAMAGRLGDPETLRTASSVALLAMLFGADPAERAELARSALARALAAGDVAHEMRARLFVALDAFERGDPRGGVRHLETYRERAAQIGATRLAWARPVHAAWAALWDGRFPDARDAAAEARGLLRNDPTVGSTFAAFAVGYARAAEEYEDLAGIEAELRTALGGVELGDLLCDLLLAALHGRASAPEVVAAHLARVAAHPAFARTTEPSWLALLVDAVDRVGDRALAARILPVLSPRADRFYTLGPLGSYCEAPYGRQLGLLCVVLGRHDAAVAHLSDAWARCEHAGMWSHLARLGLELARALGDRGAPGDGARAAELTRRAHGLAESLGQRRLLDGAPPPSERTAGGGVELRREGEVWAVAFAGRTARLRDSRGLQVLAQLVERPGEEISAVELVSGAVVPDPGDAGPALDDRAIRAYRARLRELEEEADEADSLGHAAHAERARGERDALVRELSRGVGLGGRRRRTGAAVERARTTVQKRLRSAIERIGAELPEAGRHLDRAVRTGARCVYLPDRA